MQEIVEITVDSGAAKGIWPIRTKGDTRTKVTKLVRLAAASDSPIHVEGDGRLEFARKGDMCNMKFLDADVIRPLLSVIAIDDEENIVVFGPQESHVENASTGLEDSDEQEPRRVCGAAGRTSGYEIIDDRHSDRC